MPNGNEKLEKDRSEVAGSRRSIYDLFQLPSPVKRIFDWFPLKTYPANDLPCRSPLIYRVNTLHTFTTQKGALNNAPSFNPACLKWQVEEQLHCYISSDSLFARHILISVDSSSKPSRLTTMPLQLASCLSLLRRRPLHSSHFLNQFRRTRF